MENTSGANMGCAYNKRLLPDRHSALGPQSPALYIFFVLFLANLTFASLLKFSVLGSKSFGKLKY